MTAPAILAVWTALGMLVLTPFCITSMERHCDPPP